MASSDVGNPPSTGSPPTSIGQGAKIIIGLVILLLILHQDNWFWTSDTLVFGFIPIGLAWHAGISIAASITWFLATKIAWPFDEVGQTTADTTGGEQE